METKRRKIVSILLLYFGFSKKGLLGRVPIGYLGQFLFRCPASIVFNPMFNPVDSS